MADGGTLFMDEVGDLGPTLQAKLLGVLEEGTIVRVGGTVPVRVDVRVVVATERALSDPTGQRPSREDFFGRPNTVELVLPTLAERLEDVPDLVKHFVRSSSREFGRHVVDVDPQVTAWLVRCRWPGNVRDLKYVIERSVLCARGETVQLGDLPSDLRPPPAES